MGEFMVPHQADSGPRVHTTARRLCGGSAATAAARSASTTPARSARSPAHCCHTVPLSQIFALGVIVAFIECYGIGANDLVRAVR